MFTSLRRWLGHTDDAMHERLTLARRQAVADGRQMQHRTKRVRQLIETKYGDVPPSPRTGNIIEDALFPRREEPR